jgi:hypothetical protein
VSWEAMLVLSLLKKKKIRSSARAVFQKSFSLGLLAKFKLFFSYFQSDLTCEFFREFIGTEDR